MDPRALVQQLDSPDCLGAMRGLVGGTNARELRDVRVRDDVFEALVEGLDDPRSKIRWWCIQLLDHLDDARAIDALIPCLDDPVPRVRRNAAHALGCQGCKPSWDGALPDAAMTRLDEMARLDPNAEVRAQAATALRCTRPE